MSVPPFILEVLNKDGTAWMPLVAEEMLIDIKDHMRRLEAKGYTLRVVDKMGAKVSVSYR